MEGFQQNEPAYKPEGYKALHYAPAQKIENETQMAKINKTTLERSYTLWIMIREQIFVAGKKQQKEEYDLQEVTSFDSVQDFWMIYQHLRRPTAMPYGTTLSIFQKGIRPVWEDPALTEGSRYSIKTDKSHTSKYWEDLLLAMIGEQLQEGIVAGLVLNLKPQFDKIAIWLTDSTNEEHVQQLKKDIISTLGIEEKDLEYDVFKEKRDAPQVDHKKNYNKNKNFKQFKNNKKDDWKKGEEGGFKRSEKVAKGKGEDEPQAAGDQAQNDPKEEGKAEEKPSGDAGEKGQ